MDWFELINPFARLGGAALGAMADAWTVAMLGLWNAGLWMLRLVFTLIDWFLTPDLSSSGPMGGIYPYTFWIGGVLVVALLMIQLAITAIQRDGKSLARVLIGAAQYGMVSIGFVVYAVAVLAAAGGLTKALMRSLLGTEVLSAWQPWTGFSVDDITDGTVATVLGVLGLFVIFAAIAHLLVMLTRAAALLVLAATAPIAAAGLVWEGGRAWFWKSFRWFHAAAFTPVIMVLMLGAGVQISTNVALGEADSIQAAVGSAVPGIFLILVGSFAPLALLKLLAFVDPGTSSGAAMRAGLAAQGGVQGLLRGQVGGETSSAASTSSPGGASQGEASTEAATSQKGTNAAGRLASAVGVVGSMYATGLGLASAGGTRGAVLGADLTNQMGAGHNTYIPDYPSGSSGEGHRWAEPPRSGQPRDQRRRTRRHPDTGHLPGPSTAATGPSTATPAAAGPTSAGGGAAGGAASGGGSRGWWCRGCGGVGPDRARLRPVTTP